MCKRCCCGEAKTINMVLPVIDENGNYRDGTRTPSANATEELRAFWKRCEEANDQAAGFPGNWAEVRKAMR